MAADIIGSFWVSWESTQQKLYFLKYINFFPVPSIYYPTGRNSLERTCKWGCSVLPSLWNYKKLVHGKSYLSCVS